MIPLRLSRAGAPRAPAPDDVVTRLASCHARIRHFLAEARVLATGEGDAEQRRTSARAVLTYFRDAMPLHEADEDASIAPRLRHRSAALGRSIFARMDEHGAIDHAASVLSADWQRWIDEPHAQVAIDAHRKLLAELTSALERHMTIEEKQLFPAIAALDESDRRSIVREMEARRR